MNEDYNGQQIRMTCITEAIRLKQNPITEEEFTNRTVIEIAKELETFIFRKI